ncbi:MAG: NUDIX domain-containing protein [Sphingobacteriaceae bacterium]|nr:MAG: NUDIX domain-containing protein [Sphingobacteriaceae bacterium]
MTKMNLRVYGLLIDEQNNRILLTDEQEYGMRFTKFPGGGLEYGEGLIDGLKREFIEECDMDIEVLSHFYTTDFFVKSAFNDSQVVSVYYLVENKQPFILPVKTEVFDFNGEGETLQTFRWMNIEDMQIDDVTFPIDQHVVKLLKNRIA